MEAVEEAAAVRDDPDGDAAAVVAGMKWEVWLVFVLLLEVEEVAETVVADLEQLGDPTQK